MITNSVSGLVFPKMAWPQLPSYAMKPNNYMTDLRQNLMTHAHGEALANHMVSEVKEGQSFVKKAADVATWYSPPRGHIVDTYA